MYSWVWNSVYTELSKASNTDYDKQCKYPEFGVFSCKDFLIQYIVHMTVWEFITGLFLHTNRNWFTLIEDWASIIMQINFCLTEIYARATRLRHWQIKSERFDKRVWWEQIYRLVTRYPIIQIAWIYNADYTTIEKQDVRKDCAWNCEECESTCWCWELEEVWCSCSVECNECDCQNECKKFSDMTIVAPWTPIAAWQYTIWWWKFWWWTYGNVLYVKPLVGMNSVYVSYYSFFNYLTCLDDVIPLPDSYLAALNYLVTWYIVPAASNYRTWDEKFFIEQGLRLLDEVDKYNNHAPQFIQPKR